MPWILISSSPVNSQRKNVLELDPQTKHLLSKQGILKFGNTSCHNLSADSKARHRISLFFLKYSYSKPAEFTCIQKTQTHRKRSPAIVLYVGKIEQRQLLDFNKIFIALGIKSLFNKGIIFSCTVLVF